MLVTIRPATDGTVPHAGKHPLMLLPAGGLVAAGHASHVGSGSDRIWTQLLAFAIVLVVGIGLGRKRGVKHLSEVHFKRDWNDVKNHKKF